MLCDKKFERYYNFNLLMYCKDGFHWVRSIDRTGFSEAARVVHA